MKIYNNETFKKNRYKGSCFVIETLHTLGKKLLLQGCENPLSKIKKFDDYRNIEEVKESIKEIGQERLLKGFNTYNLPISIGIIGSGDI